MNDTANSSKKTYSTEEIKKNARLVQNPEGPEQWYSALTKKYYSSFPELMNDHGYIVTKEN